MGWQSGLLKETRKAEGGRETEKERQEYNEYIEKMRKSEYPMLHNTTYLDHAGTALASRTLIENFSKAMLAHLLTNPHSAGIDSPNFSQVMIEEARRKVLAMFNTNQDQFDIIFVANATAGIKLVMEAFRGRQDGFEYYYHRDSHTSLVGVRELAQYSHCLESDEETHEWLCGGIDLDDKPEGLKLFAYPAQSNMNGRRLPLTWPQMLRSNPRHIQSYSLLDVAALVSTSRLDLSDHASAPDFTVMSFYKIFGFPDLGALIVRKAAGNVFVHRRYFGGGTTEMITCLETPWFKRKEKSLPSRCEDGTLAIRSILALSCAIDVHQKIFGGIDKISSHTGWLAKILYDRLNNLRYANGQAVCKIYKDDQSAYGDPTLQGATVTFNVCNRDGTWVGSSVIGKLAVEKKIYIRTGSLCNPAGMARSLGLTDNDVQRAFDSGFRCGQEYDVRYGTPMGMIRASLGGMSTLRDVGVFVDFVRDCFVGQWGKIKVPTILYAGRMAAENWKRSDETRGKISKEDIVVHEKTTGRRWTRHFRPCSV